MTARGAGRVRIISGSWRGRRLPVPAHAGLRPTPDRVRETVFNWLADLVPGSSCLDLFAGTGALGFEAASRGAARVVMVERAREAAAGLRHSREMLDAAAVAVVHAEARGWLARAAEAGDGPFDLVFLDPPYDSGLLAPTFAAVAASSLLAPGALVYLEDRTADLPLPPGWSLRKRARAGQIHFGLATGPGGA